MTFFRKGVLGSMAVLVLAAAAHAAGLPIWQIVFALTVGLAAGVLLTVRLRRRAAYLREKNGLPPITVSRSGISGPNAPAKPISKLTSSLFRN
jgi:hypothetical protein